MKKRIVFFLAAVLIVTMFSGLASANAENPAEIDLTKCSVYNGYVQGAAFFDIVAPCSGVVQPFDLSVGDVLEKDAEAFHMMTTCIYAPEDGTVVYVYAGQGELADVSTTKYGGVLAIRPSNNKWMVCSFLGAYDSDECKEVHIGDTLYFGNSNADGYGIVVGVSGNTYQLEVVEGDLKNGENAFIYLDEEHSDTKRVGTGTLVVRDDIVIPGSGLIDSIFVKRRHYVKKGDKLFSLLSKDADYGASSSVKAGMGGVVTVIPVAPGQQVWKGQLLARISSTEDMEIVAEVDEVDVMNVQVGDKLPVTLDVDESRVFEGTVTEISASGSIRQNATYYAIHVAVEKSDMKMMIGQGASVFIP